MCTTDGTTDKELLAIMRQFEEEAERHGCTIVERKEDFGGFLGWEGDLPDLRTHAVNDGPGESDLPKLLRDNLSLSPRALRAFQELGLAMGMADCTPRLKHKGPGIYFVSSKISRPATWITQEVVRKLAMTHSRTQFFVQDVGEISRTSQVLIIGSIL
jgi:hypothetical protein